MCLRTYIEKEAFILALWIENILIGYLTVFFFKVHEVYERVSCQNESIMKTSSARFF